MDFFGCCGCRLLVQSLCKKLYRRNALSKKQPPLAHFMRVSGIYTLPGAKVSGFGREKHGNHEGTDVGEALEPLECVIAGVNLSSRLRSCLEPLLAPSHPRRRMVCAQPSIVPAPERRLLAGNAQRPRRANVE